MDAYVTFAPATPPPLTVFETTAVTKGIKADDGAFAVLIGGIVGAALLLVICIIAVLLWCLSRHKGSYITNETDDDMDDMDDDGSVGSDTALQSREPLKVKEEE
ncbi:small cell adhesion glycoprotein homolog [Chelmon rostratus]|uniref:small cell adhesion glycoprotein homolog n=1 Tax=Chelmon rostratus TaxID=109905 RepID=UPI001BE7DD01|nr:small cell adhesion glycoprotein homolog [Chelmon rostratus]